MWNRLSLSLVGKMTFSCHLNKSKHKSSSHKNKMNHATSPVSAAWMQCLSNAGISREYNLNFKGCLSLTCAGITGIKHVLIIAWAQQFLSSNVNVRTENGVMTVSQVRTHFFLYNYTINLTVQGSVNCYYIVSFNIRKHKKLFLYFLDSL